MNWLTYFFVLTLSLQPVFAEEPPYDFELPGGKVVVIGDTHRKNPTAIFQKNPNKKIPLVLNQLAAEPDVVAVIHVGDVVQTGSIKRTSLGRLGQPGWDAFKQDAQTLLAKGTPIFPVLGNHDYRGRKSKALKNFYDAFPYLKGKRYYSVKVGDTLFLMLDSNFAKFSKEARQQQALWFEEMLKRGQTDKAVNNIVSVFHHPPYGDTFLKMKDYVPTKTLHDFATPALGYSKARFFLSGHIHQYENRLIVGRYFTVTGGAGTSQWSKIWRPRSFIEKDRARIMDFHYLRIIPAAIPIPNPWGISGLIKGLVIEMVQFNNGNWKVGHEFLLF